MQNFEALGRYTAAEDNAKKLKVQRQSAVQKLMQLAARAGGDKEAYPKQEFNASAARELIDQIEDIQSQLQAVVDEGNVHAAACGKFKLSSS